MISIKNQNISRNKIFEAITNIKWPYLTTIFDGSIKTIVQSVALEINVVIVGNGVQERIRGQIESVK